MQVGCGVYVHTVHRRRYLYFWHYETRAGSRIQEKEYVGPAASHQARGEAMRRCEACYGRMVKDLETMKAASLAGIRAMAGT